MDLGPDFNPVRGSDPPAPEAEAKPHPELPRADLTLDDWLDVASTLALSSDHPESTLESVRRCGGLRRGEMWMEGEKARAEKAAQLPFKDEQLRDLRRLRAEIERDLVQKQELESSQQVIESAIRDQDLRLRARREAAEASRFEAELQRLDAERERALFDGQDPAEALANAQRTWDEQAPVRIATTARLEAELTRMRQTAAAARSRLEQATPPMMTKTVAGFLIWIGYGSILATGTVLSRLLGGASSWDPSTVLEAMRAFVSFVPDSPPPRFLVLWILVSVGLAATVWVAIVCDRRMRAFDGKWDKDAAESNTIQLSPGGITRRTYGRLLSSVPFLFAGGTVASFIAAAPNNKQAAELLKSILPSITNAFIGTAIALLCTAAFLLYVIRIMERPLATAQPARRRPWEVAALVVVLLVAIVLSVALPPSTSTVTGWAAFRDAAPWGGWTLFMLLSSLTFAYGLIHHGLYKDVDKLDGRVEEIDRAIRRNLEPPSLAQLRRRSLASARETAKQYADERLWWEKTARRYRAGRSLGLDIDLAVLLSRASKVPGLRWLSPFRNPRREAGIFAVPDSEVAEDILQILRELYGWRWKYAKLIEEVQARITDKGTRASWDNIAALQQERASLLADIAGSLPADAARMSENAMAEEELSIRIVAAIAAAQRVRPAFSAIAADAERSAALRGVQLIVPPPASGH